MGLRSNNPSHNNYFKSRSIVMDTCAITWIAKELDGLEIFDILQKEYLLLIPTPVLFELAFGSPESVHLSEKLIRDKFINAQQIDPYKYHIAHDNGQLPESGYYLVNPSHMEWWSARERLLKYIGLSPQAQYGKNKQKYSLDALIHSCARNLFTPVCTLNIKDFQKMNIAGGLLAYDGTIPIVTPEQLLESIKSDIYCYE